MTSDSSQKADFRAPSAGRRLPRAVADVAGSPEQVFRALTTNEVEQWWRNPGVHRQRDWHADLRVCGPWSVTVQMTDGATVHAKGEFCELDPPRKIVMTRTFDDHPFLGSRETTITYRLEPSPYGTLVTVRDEGFIGRSEAAYGNAEIWERVVAWLDESLRQKT
jgi:uncharacterized protein YndB with AHSA1/START domain